LLNFLFGGLFAVLLNLILPDQSSLPACNLCFKFVGNYCKSYWVK